jgi:hypothetical protein
MFNWVNSKIKKFNWLDMGLIKLSVAAFALMLAKLWSPLLALQWYWYLIFFVILAIRPIVKMCKK